VKRGELVVSVRQLARSFNWSHGNAQRFLALLVENSMISRVVRESLHPAVHEAGHFIVCNYDTYNPARYADRYARRYTKRYNLKEVLKERINKDLKITASVGIGTCKVVAKIGSALCKPDGLLEIVPGGEQAFLNPLPIAKLPGWAKKQSSP
jgi:hypothetical protein